METLNLFGDKNAHAIESKDRIEFKRSHVFYKGHRVAKVRYLTHKHVMKHGMYNKERIGRSRLVLRKADFPVVI